MGTDISMYAEVRGGTGTGQWSLAGPLEKNPDWAADESAGEPADREPPLRPRRIYTTRNYALFAILADVCNPVRAVTPFECLSKPRGLPPDLSRPLIDWHAHCARWEGNAVAESWLTVEELTAFDWHGKRIVRRGMVHPTATHLFPPGRRGFPVAEWPEGLPVSVANWSTSGVEVRWVETYAEAVGEEFMTKTLSALRSYGRPQDVRIVFWFDR